MKIGIGLPNQLRDVRPTVIPEWASRAEAAGFSTLSTVGRVAYPGVMDTVALAAAAGATTSIGLTSSVMLAPVWPPALLAKELAAIDGISRGRLTVGIGIGGNRQDDFVVEGLPGRGLGRRMDHDLEVYRSVWRGETFGGGPNPGVPTGTREVPMLFGGLVPAAYERVAAWGQGYIGGAVPAPAVQPHFEGARRAWEARGREGAPKLVALAYFVLGDADRGRANLRDYYLAIGPDHADQIARSAGTHAVALKETIESFAAIGADELILLPGLDDVNEVDRLAEAVL